METFRITTLGCKVNQYESAALAATLEKFSLRPAEKNSPADLACVNSCCITATAIRKTRQAVRKILRSNPGCRVAVVGCLGTYHEKLVRDIFRGMDVPPEKTFVAGHHDDTAAELETWLRHQKNAQKSESTPLDIKKTAQKPENTPLDIKKRRLATIEAAPAATEHLSRISRFAGHQRAFVKIQDGCDAMCAYCVVPFTRSRVWSRGMDDIVDECTQLVKSGHREIVLCGVFIGAYGRETAVRRNWPGGSAPLVKILRRVADIPNIWRVRLGSIEPLDVTDELLEACREIPAVAPHFHMAMQSGSTRILGLMNRQYTAEEFCQAVAKLNEALDSPAVTTDVIVGFPDETDEDFAQTLQTARTAGFSKIHAFPFSAIEPTPAWVRRDRTPPVKTVQKRMAQLAKLETQLAEKYREKFVGKKLEALVESSPAPKGSKHEYHAMTDRYLAVSFDSAEKLSPGTLAELHITGHSANGLTGEISKTWV